MIKTVVSDFSKVLLFAKDPNYQGGLNALNKRLLAEDPSYPFFDHFVLNQQLLDYYLKLSEIVPVIVFTTETIQDHPAIEPLLAKAVHGVLSAKKLGLVKTNPAAYSTVSNLVHARPAELLYIDDKEANIQAAEQAGLNTILYTSNNEVITKLGSLFDRGV